MDLLFRLSNEDQEKIVKFLSTRYSETELFSILRHLDIDKNSIYNKYVPKIVNCENIVERILEKDLSSDLFLLLQSKEEFYRKSFFEEFSHLDFVIDEQTFEKSSNKLFNLLPSENLMPVNEWISLCKTNMVLILGKDSPEQYLEYLENIASILSRKGYQPILIKKQPEVSTMTNEEKMLAYASLSRFVIIEKSEAAGQIDEAKICAFNRLPSIWIQEKDKGDTWMQSDYEVDFKNIKTFKYDASSLEQCLEQGIDWVEEYLTDKTNKLNTLYPWRKEIDWKY